jgi:hypothetical protein
MIQARAPAQAPSPPPLQQPWLRILFRHPGYDDSNNVLFKLHAPDANNDGHPGLYAQLALDACVIVTGNSDSRGWLSLSRDGSNMISPTSTLRGRSYYFHLADSDVQRHEHPYPIVPNFSHWSYPHERLPAHWRQMAPPPATVSSTMTLAPSNLTTALLLRDGSCRLSGCREQVQVAHVVPQSERDWWLTNDMSRYNTGSAASLDDAANALLLRADLHIAFDKPCIAFYPKPAADADAAADTEMRLVAHVLEPSLELEHLYHNRELHSTVVGVDMLYARFAWSIFTLLDAFLECKIDRRLVLRTPSDPKLTDSCGFVTARNCELFSTTATRKRSQSPKKRKPDRDTVADELDKFTETPSETRQPILSETHQPVASAVRQPISTEIHQSVPTETRRKRKSIPQAEGPNHTPAKRICQKPSVSTSTSGHSPTCPPTGSTLSPLDSPSSLPPPSPTFAQAWLEAERQRSDPDGTWNKEHDWAQQVWNGKTLSSDEVERWLVACGVEIRGA